MEKSNAKTLLYRRSRFTSPLPVEYLYSPSHAWLAPQPGGAWRVGLTKFATRMLGEMVDHEIEVKSGTEVAHGAVIGWVEGFKAISDLYCTVDGIFLGSNTALQKDIALISRQPYQAGWLYLASGEPDGQCMDVQAYVKLLDKTIDRILEKQEHQEDA